jgi:hypothetical protein
MLWGRTALKSIHMQFGVAAVSCSSIPKNLKERLE